MKEFNYRISILLFTVQYIYIYSKKSIKKMPFLWTMEGFYRGAGEAGLHRAPSRDVSSIESIYYLQYSTIIFTVK